MTLAQDLVDPSSALAAVVRVLPTERADFVASAFRDKSVRALSLDFVVSRDAQALRSAIASGLGFPEHYGRNWDALADVFFEIRGSGVETVLLVVEDSMTMLADEPADREIFLSLLSDLLEQRRRPESGAPVLVRIVDLAESESEFGGVSISLSLDLDEPLQSEPSVLAEGHRRDPCHYGFTLHREGLAKPADEVNSFLRAMMQTLEVGGVNAEWVRQHNARVRAYLSIHPGIQTPAVAFDPDVIAALARLGATIDLDVL